MECSLKFTDLEQVKCVKRKCSKSRGDNFDCVYNAISEICKDSASIYNCIQSKIVRICENERDSMCSKKYNSIKTPVKDFDKVATVYTLCLFSAGTDQKKIDITDCVRKRMKSLFNYTLNKKEVNCLRGIKNNFKTTPKIMTNSTENQKNAESPFLDIAACLL